MYDHKLLSLVLLSLAMVLGLGRTVSASALQDPAPAAPPAFDALAAFEEVFRERILPVPKEKPAKEESEEDAEPDDDAAFVWARCMAVEGLVEVYRHRRDDRYLERAFTHMNELLDLRDSVLKRRDAERKAALPAWSASSSYPAAYEPVQLAGAPTTRRLSPALTALVVACGMELVNQIEADSRLFKLHKREVKSLEADLRKALAVFDEEYRHAPAGKEGYYFPPGLHEEALLSADLALLGRAHLALSKKRKGKDLDRAEYLAQFLKSRFSPGADGVTLRWASRGSPNGRGGNNERTFHAGLLADFAARAKAQGIVFDDKDAKALRETMLHIVLEKFPEVPRILTLVRPDDNSEMMGLSEALPWLWSASIDPTLHDHARRVMQKLGAQAPAEGLLVLAALVEDGAAPEADKK